MNRSLSSAEVSAETTSPASEDAVLIRRYVESQDDRAFEQLVLRHGPMVYGVCQRVLGNSHAADDAFQTTFLWLVRKAPLIQHPERLANWLYGTAYRTAVKLRAKLGNHTCPLESSRRATQDESELDAESIEIHEILDEELSQLPSKYRAPLVLCYLEGATHATAAKTLNLPTGSVSRRIQRGKQLLRSRLLRRGISSVVGLSPLLAQLQTAQAMPSLSIHALSTASAASGDFSADALPGAHHVTEAAVSASGPSSRTLSASASAWILGVATCLLLIASSIAIDREIIPSWNDLVSRFRTPPASPCYRDQEAFAASDITEPSDESAVRQKKLGNAKSD